VTPHPQKFPIYSQVARCGFQGKYSQSGQHTIKVNGLVNGRESTVTDYRYLACDSDDKNNPIL